MRCYQIFIQVINPAIPPGLAVTEACCGTHGGITSTDQSGRDQLWRRVEQLVPVDLRVKKVFWK